MTRVRHSWHRDDMTAENNQGAVLEFTLGWRLRRALAHAGIEAGDMADELNIDRATLSRWTHDKYRRPINPLFLRTIATRCGVDYDWLKDGISPTTGRKPGGSRRAFRRAELDSLAASA